MPRAVLIKMQVARCPPNPLAFPESETWRGVHTPESVQPRLAALPRGMVRAEAALYTESQRDGAVRSGKYREHTDVD